MVAGASIGYRRAGPRSHGRPEIVDWYMEGKIEIDPMITHRLALSQSTRVLTSARGKKHQKRGSVLKQLFAAAA